MIAALFAGFVPAGAARSETVLSAEEFDRFTTGTTLYFARRGTAYGAEQYLSGRRVIWTFLDGTCQRGLWYPEGDGICFQYEGQPDAQCWHFLETRTGKSARVIGDDPRNDLRVVGQNTAPVECLGPQVGVRFTR
ncbi:MAG: hypothetical protein JXR14_08855 [Paracoccaceae bacterium]